MILISLTSIKGGNVLMTLCSVLTVKSSSKPLDKLFPTNVVYVVEDLC